jgi:hypothetical protein
VLASVLGPASSRALVNVNGTAMAVTDMTFQDKPMPEQVPFSGTRGEHNLYTTWGKACTTWGNGWLWPQEMCCKSRCACPSHASTTAYFIGAV